MKNTQFHFELRDTLREFSRAFNDIVISRYDKKRNFIKNVPVRFIAAPKKRVIYALTNKADNITLPAISVNIQSYSLDTTRIQNKIPGMGFGTSMDNVGHMNQPVPIDMVINVSIIGKNHLDVDQILSNFIPNTNPYFIIVIPLPANLAFGTQQELRLMCDWSGSVALNYSTEVAKDDPQYVTADTSFTIKTWIFPRAEPVGKIYTAVINYRDKTTNEIIDNQTLVGDPDTGDITLENALNLQ